MLEYPPTEEEFRDQSDLIYKILFCEESCITNAINNDSYHKSTRDKLKRAVNLGNTKIGSGHDNFLNGVIVQFDLTFTIKAWPEVQRYHFFDFVSSMSTMHRIAKIADDKNSFISYVTEETFNEVMKHIKNYNENPTKENYLALIYNSPVGLKITARVTTNYRQLKTIRNQRDGHKLVDEWGVFCDWVDTLPLFKEICLEKQE